MSTKCFCEGLHDSIDQESSRAHNWQKNIQSSALSSYRFLYAFKQVQTKWLVTFLLYFKFFDFVNYLKKTSKHVGHTLWHIQVLNCKTK